MAAGDRGVMGGLHWVRVDPYVRPGAGTVVLKCSGPGCGPDPRRFTDPQAARSAALEHVRVHAARLANPRPRTRCRCRSEHCGWHPRRNVGCGGPVETVVIPDAVGRLWTVTQVCGPCATAIPRAHALRTAPAAVPGTPSGSAPATGSTRSAGAAVRHGGGEEKRARACPLCTAGPDGAGERRGVAARPVAAGARPVAPQWGPRLSAVLRHLQQVNAEGSAEARLLALTVVLRARGNGEVHLAPADLGPGRVDVPGSTLAELERAGLWRGETAATAPKAGVVRGSVAQTVAELVRLGVTDALRPRLGAWVERVLAHPLLRGPSAGVRLAALFLLARSGPTGRVQFTTTHLADLCGLDDAEEATRIVAVLLRCGVLLWVRTGTAPGQRLTATLAQDLVPLVPGARPADAAPPEPAAGKAWPIQERGKEADIAAWVATYRAGHGHGPRAHEMLAAHCAENPEARWAHHSIAAAVQRLVDDGWLLVERGRWWSTRPGPAYARHLEDQEARERLQQETDAVLRGLMLIPGAEVILGGRAGSGKSPVPCEAPGRRRPELNGRGGIEATPAI
jgi:hypothetical protein